MTGPFWEKASVNSRKPVMEKSHNSAVEEIFQDYKGRRYGILKALTTEYKEFYRRCNPNTNEMMCLYGYPGGRWEVTSPPDYAPPQIPDPTSGINFSRDHTKDWSYLVALHSDLWLLRVAFFDASQLGCSKDEREQLFDCINSLPTVWEVLRMKDAAKRQQKGNSKLSSKLGMPQSLGEKLESLQENDDKEDGVCGACGAHYIPGKVDVLYCTKEGEIFWILCESCERWFHGHCVLVTPKMAKHINKYKCPSCPT